VSKISFDHEKLRAYQDSLRFAAFVDAIISELPAKVSARDQLDRASTSVVLNIAEGDGRRSRTDRCRFLDMARGSALESAACLDLLVVKNLITVDRASGGKELLVGIVSMIVGLLETFGAQLSEEPAEYNVSSRSKHD
jgi:four helix bundle protein